VFYPRAGTITLTDLLSGQTSDLVKRRYSTRFANLPSDFDPTAPPVPTVPSLPRQYAPSGGQGRGASPGGGRGLTVDLNALRDPGLRPEQC
jgi:exocyst complex component 8